MLSMEDKGARREEQGRHRFIAGAAPLLSLRRGKAGVNSPYGALLGRRARTVEGDRRTDRWSWPSVRSANAEAPRGGADFKGSPGARDALGRHAASAGARPGRQGDGTARDAGGRTGAATSRSSATRCGVARFDQDLLQKFELKCTEQ
jgi:hypothetical protein